ncbi:MAG: efflux RND transporter periplasmic adaptor subunit [candidate division Zixibacteria bacterium]|nr:efflux RND transporter periplasmic adaptor subunit [candidate division Zixibacteria bacterium]MDD5426421.1 efflux RND transporter periplasmic adaptor subunit [candidate division Zixibacteria bacterium]
MRLRSWLYVLIPILVIIAGYYIYKSNRGKAETTYQFASLVRGDLESTISATGTLSPVTTVDVGTQVSGTIDTVFVDYNDNVRQGQLLAVLDTLLLKMAVLDAEASVEKAEAMLREAEANYNRNKQLFDKGMLADADLLSFEVSVKAQKATLKSAQASLERARRNLEYAVIRSPISGMVISKNVETGQTVAASFSTPTLFKIAEDLSRMEILVDVDEGDIGMIKAGQEVRFEVQAYSDKVFTGVVTKVRMQPTTVSNVVTYTVVVAAANEDNLLLPGMTAMVDFIIEQKDDVLLVANKALRFTPTNEQLQAFQERRKKEFENLPDSLKNERRARMGGGARADTGSQNSQMMPRQRPKDMGQLWYLDERGQLQMEIVRTGMTDGTSTEIVHCRNLAEGDRVIGGVGTAATNNTKTNSQPRGFRPPPGF